MTVTREECFAEFSKLDWAGSGEGSLLVQIARKVLDLAHDIVGVPKKSRKSGS